MKLLKHNSVFVNYCLVYQTGYMNLDPKDNYAFDLFKGRSINWVQFSKKYPLTVIVKVLDIATVPVLGNAVFVWHSRFGIQTSYQAIQLLLH